MKRAIFLALCAGAAHADPTALGGITADVATTSIGQALGHVEANPAGWALLPVRIAVVERAKALSPEQGLPVLHAVSATSWGAAANNLLVMAGAGPAAPVLGLVVGIAVWKAGEPERHFWQACAVHRQDRPALRCVYAPLHVATASVQPGEK